MEYRGWVEGRTWETKQRKQQVFNVCFKLADAENRTV